jgi:hypothetical protein
MVVMIAVTDHRHGRRKRSLVALGLMVLLSATLSLVGHAVEWGLATTYVVLALAGSLYTVFALPIVSPPQRSHADDAAPPSDPLDVSADAYSSAPAEPSSVPSLMEALRESLDDARRSAGSDQEEKDRAQPPVRYETAAPESLVHALKAAPSEAQLRVALRRAGLPEEEVRAVCTQTTQRARLYAAVLLFAQAGRSPSELAEYLHLDLRAIESASRALRAEHAVLDPWLDEWAHRETH